MRKNLFKTAFSGLFLLTVCHSGFAAEWDELDAALAAFESKYHVQIHHHYNPQSFFPRNWNDPLLQMVAAPIKKQDAETLVPTLERFLSSHPAGILDANLKHIYLLGKLSFMGRDYGGTHADGSIYIVWDRTRKYSSAFVLERCHSEFSSLLRNHYPFPDDQWQAINPDGFSYSGTGFEMLGTGSVYSSAELEQENGFLAKYSMSSIENDFNTISAWLFTRPSELYATGVQHERIGRKIELATAFYTSISDRYVFRQDDS